MLLLLDRYREAEPIAFRSVQIRKDEWGEKHPGSIISQTTLGQILLAESRLDEAEAVLTKACQTWSKDRKYNSHRASCALHLAELATARNRVSEAEQLAADALLQLEKHHGQDHEDVSQALGILAVIKIQSNSFSDAEGLLSRAVSIDARRLPSNHPTSATHLSDLAEVYIRSNRPLDAEPLLKKALTIQRRILPERAPSTLMTMSRYTRVLQATERKTQAEEFERELKTGKALQ